MFLYQFFVFFFVFQVFLTLFYPEFYYNALEIFLTTVSSSWELKNKFINLKGQQVRVTLFDVAKSHVLVFRNFHTARKDLHYDFFESLDLVKKSVQRGS